MFDVQTLHFSPLFALMFSMSNENAKKRVRNTMQRLIVCLNNVYSLQVAPGMSARSS